ncbi:hypothetical protein [Streptomyces lushanensis]|uniref:hypothetical protein n=1 Tax=Streptomyces lushanensis TaxID=1434255 RepID=UPI0008373BD5|nr:hypothetical protein [Streptomyces lushanensis]
MIKMLHEKGLRSEHMYTAGVVSIGLAIASWAGSMKYEPVGGLDRADRWGIFVGEWAPTFFGMGLALSQYERTEKEAEILREEIPRDLSRL